MANDNQNEIYTLKQQINNLLDALKAMSLAIAHVNASSNKVSTWGLHEIRRELATELDETRNELMELLND